MASSAIQDRPLRISIVVYDLLPPSTLASVLNFVGAGVYHSAVSISLPTSPQDPRPVAREYAYGGHDLAGVTGIFSIPSGTAHLRMEHVRLYMTLECGEAFGNDWERVFQPKRRRGSAAGRGSQMRERREVHVDLETQSTGTTESGSGRRNSSDTKEMHVDSPPYEWQGSGASTSHLALGQEAEGGGSGGSESGQESIEDEGREFMSRSERRAMRILDEMRKDPEWFGTSYKLLGRNCNTFTDELVWRLTGRRAPGWLNRAAFVATSVPCLIPEGWIDEDEVEVREQRPCGTVLIEPPRADRMELLSSRPGQ